MKYTAYDYALTILSYHPKTVGMMKKTLLSKGYSLDEVERTLDRLNEQDYLNDYEFCKAYLTSEVINKGKSLPLITKKLYEKLMPKDIIKQVSEELANEIAESTVGNLAKEIQKFHDKGIDIITIYEKLARKGHHYDNIKQALEYLNHTK